MVLRSPNVAEGAGFSIGNDRGLSEYSLIEFFIPVGMGGMGSGITDIIRNKGVTREIK